MTAVDSAKAMARFVAAPLAQHYRRTGADLPFSDPLCSHGTEMEGWFWRWTDAATERAAVALFSVNRHPDGDWATSIWAHACTARSASSAVCPMANPMTKVGGCHGSDGGDPPARRRRRSG
ncbi:hypothetical protein [Mycobacterium sp. IDR2000157661]|uniref:hypothetical protein n=1 Tax=Mycobacterium sp. IDR2000157661 TaxID=2867005 RepID=UPI00351D91CA